MERTAEETSVYRGKLLQHQRTAARAKANRASYGNKMRVKSFGSLRFLLSVYLCIGHFVRYMGNHNVHHVLSFVAVEQLDGPMAFCLLCVRR